MRFTNWTNAVGNLDNNNLPGFQTWRQTATKVQRWFLRSLIPGLAPAHRGSWRSRGQRCRAPPCRRPPWQRCFVSEWFNVVRMSDRKMTQTAPPCRLSPWWRCPATSRASSASPLPPSQSTVLFFHHRNSLPSLLLTLKMEQTTSVLVMSNWPNLLLLVVKRITWRHTTVWP